MNKNNPFKEEYIGKINEINKEFEEIWDITNDEYAFIPDFPEELFGKIDLLTDKIIEVVPDISPKLSYITDNLCQAYDELSIKNKEEGIQILKETEKLWQELEPKLIEWINNIQ